VRRNPQIGALVVGGREARPAQTHSASNDTAPAVTFTGKVPYSEVPRYINAMDICVIPNATWYGSPTKLFEYGAMGRPVVASKFPPIEEIIVHGISGLLFKPNDKADMMRQILTLVESPRKRDQLGSTLRKKIEASYTWERNTERMIGAVAQCRFRGSSQTQEPT